MAAAVAHGTKQRLTGLAIQLVTGVRREIQRLRGNAAFTAQEPS
jgi:hypothetical protein